MGREDFIQVVDQMRSNGLAYLIRHCDGAIKHYVFRFCLHEYRPEWGGDVLYPHNPAKVFMIDIGIGENGFIPVIEKSDFLIFGEEDYHTILECAIGKQNIKAKLREHGLDVFAELIL